MTTTMTMMIDDDDDDNKEKKRAGRPNQARGGGLSSELVNALSDVGDVDGICQDMMTNREQRFGVYVYVSVCGCVCV